MRNEFKPDKTILVFKETKGATERWLDQIVERLRREYTRKTFRVKWSDDDGPCIPDGIVVTSIFAPDLELGLPAMGFKVNPGRFL